MIKDFLFFFKALSYFIYTIIINYVCIDYLCSESKKLHEIGLCSRLSNKTEEKVKTKYWEFEFQIW